MANFIVVGKSRNVVVAVLQAIHSFTDAHCVVIGDYETKGLGWSTLCDSQIALRFEPQDDELFVRHVNNLAAAMPHAVLIPADCEGIRMTNRVRDRLQVPITPIPEPELLEVFDDKWRFHQLCTEHEIPVPPALLAAGKHELDFSELAAEFGLPFVVKPTNQAGSLGVQIVPDEAHFNQHIRDNDNYRFAPLLAQRYIDGPDIDVSLLALHGKVSAVAVQQVVGAEVRFLPNAALEHIAGELCRSSGYHGVMHIDARIEKSSGRIYLFESNPRFWVSLTAAAWCGLNFVAESVAQPARPKGALTLISGTAYARHPLLRPACWPLLMRDRGARGKLLRAMTFDFYTLSLLLRELPSMCGRYVAKHAMARIEQAAHFLSIATKDYADGRKRDF
jgi:predicted ATP-grasp superfamily ATP-dependent carboligase